MAMSGQSFMPGQSQPDYHKQDTAHSNISNAPLVPLLKGWENKKNYEIQTSGMEDMLILNN